ncbi:MAG: phosphatidylglycerol lysyltransferase domain-containing protein [Phenylobacterium sp.]|jgi:glycosyltransferase 2 family protein|uniref:phosphatidylglycerol lysyltransferase domain-containing protein n=1 Tax=Phenylobacterium sp. TaxID=1871053 RepID=UPI00391C9076
MRFWRELKPAVYAAAPLASAVLTLLAGLMLLASAATPTIPSRYLQLYEFAPVLLIEVSHFLSSVMGLALVLIAFGLKARLDAAWAAAVAALLIAAPLAIVKAYAWEEGAALAVLALLLLPLRGAYPRRARLSQMEVTPGWLISAAAAVAGVGLLGFWSFENADYGAQPFWRVMADEDAARAQRAWVAVALLLFAFGLWRLFASAATPKVAGEADPELARVRAILSRAEEAEPSSNLALLGDKRFIFSPSGESFLMFGIRGRSWISLGAPVGRRDERLDLMWRFRELADAHAARPGFYGLDAEHLPDIVELGFSIAKVGEAAAVSLDTFTIEGTKRGNLRRAWRQACEAGAQFEVVPPERVHEIMPQLQAISNAWLKHHAGGDKSFSMGGFYPRYVCEFPVGIVRFEGEIVAFATLWVTAARTAFSIDLMRYVDKGPRRIMDYLFVELIEWGRREGYQAVDFGMAPLSGLDDRPLAPILSRVGNLLFERGEEIYNFQGVRAYKGKYDPVWRPRYIAAPNRWAIPLVLADMGLLTSGGVAGLAKRPREPAKAAA